MAKKLIEEEKDIEYGVVAYSDGSAGPTNPGYWGAGTHGYLYRLDALGKQTGKRPNNFSITDRGYIHKDVLEKEDYVNVTPEYYFDGLYSFSGEGTNNMGELEALILTLTELYKIAGIKKILVKLDSEYVIAVYKAVKDFDNVSWRERAKNQEFLERLRIIVNSILTSGITLELTWVKGHSNSWGNHNADRMAMAARLYSERSNANTIEFNLIKADTYYTSGGTDRHPFLRFSNLYFMGLKTVRNDRSLYSIMQYKSDMEPGRASHEAIFGLVSLKTPQPLIEDVIAWYTSKTTPTMSISTIDLNLLFNRKVMTLHAAFKEKAYNFSRTLSALKFRDEEVIVKAIRPPGLANAAVERTVMLYGLLDEYNMKDTIPPKRKYVDLTDMIYGLNDKGKPITLLTNKDSFMMIDVTVDDTMVKFPVFLGKDCITRDHFKQIEALDTKVYLVYNKIGETLINYYILIDCKATGDQSIWCNFYNNNILLPIKKKQLS